MALVVAEVLGGKTTKETPLSFINSGKRSWYQHDLARPKVIREGPGAASERMKAVRNELQRE